MDIDGRRGGAKNSRGNGKWDNKWGKMKMTNGREGKEEGGAGKRDRKRTGEAGKHNRFNERGKAQTSEAKEYFFILNRMDDSCDTD